jgi:hypothetical protein
MFGKIIIQFILFFKIFVKKMNGCLFWKGVFNIFFSKYNKQEALISKFFIYIFFKLNPILNFIVKKNQLLEAKLIEFKTGGGGGGLDKFLIFTIFNFYYREETERVTFSPGACFHKIVLAKSKNRTLYPPSLLSQSQENCVCVCSTKHKIPYHTIP